MNIGDECRKQGGKGVKEKFENEPILQACVPGTVYGFV